MHTMDVSFSKISDQFLEKLNADFDALGHERPLDISKVDTLSMKQLDTVMSLMHATWEDVHRHIRSQLIDGMGISKFFVLCSDPSSKEIVAFAKYGPVPQEKKIAVSEFGVQQDYTGAAVRSLARYFSTIIHHNLIFNAFSVATASSVKESRKSACTTDIGPSVDGITGKLMTYQGMADIKSAGSLSQRMLFLAIRI